VSYIGLDVNEGIVLCGIISAKIRKRYGRERK